jgi:Cu(I)/Ag(I) efflux system membrane protein CusA/SilA
MLSRLLRFSVRRPLLVCALFALGALAGGWSFLRSPLDAIPDLSEPQVLLYARVAGSPVQVSDSATAPLMRKLSALPGVKTVRGFSDLGYSYVTVVLERADQAVRTRAAAAAREDRVHAWQVAQDASGVGWVYQYSLGAGTSGLDLYELRTLQDQVLGPALAALPGVAEVPAVGGYVRRLEVVANPRLLQVRGLQPPDLTAGLPAAAEPPRGRMLMLDERDVLLGLEGESPRAVTSAASPAPAAKVPETGSLESIEIRPGLKLGELARVRQAPDLRRGIADLDGQGEVVGGVVVAAQGVNALDLVARVKARLESLKPRLPKGVDLETVYDRSQLIRASLGTVRRELLQELLLVSLAVYLFLGHAPSMWVLGLALPAAILLHFLPLHLARLSVNLMTLGGLAIAIGDMLDAGIILVENANRRLADAGPVPEAVRREVLAEACISLIRPLLFTLVIVVVSFLPVFALEGQEGRLFQPLAASKTLSMLSAMAVTLLLVPALSALFLKRGFKREEQNPLSAWLQSKYRPSLAWALSRPKLSLAVNFGLLLLTIPLFLRLPREFLPPLNEGSLLYMPVTMAGVPAAQASAFLKEADRRLAAVPEVERVFGKAGRAESATDPAPLSMVESTILLKPRRLWRKGMDEAGLVREMDQTLQFTGVSNGWTQPIRGRIDMQATGIRTPLGLKVSAQTLEQAEAAAAKAETICLKLPGIRSAAAERAGRAPSLMYFPDEAGLKKAGLTAGQVQGQLLCYAGGAALASVSGTAVAAVYPEDFTDNLDKMRRFPIFSAPGRTVPLSALGRVELAEGADMVPLENGLPTVHVYLDLDSRDTVGWVQAHGREVLDPLRAIPGVRAEFSGQYEADQRARRRMSWLVPACGLLIALLLWLAFGSLAESGMILLSVPYALLGGIWIQALLGIPLSVSAWVGYIALFAVAVQTGVVMVVYLQQATSSPVTSPLPSSGEFPPPLSGRRGEGGSFAQAGRGEVAPLKEAVLNGAVLRLRPKLMTVATNVIGFFPLLWTKGAGDDLLASVAAPIVGGMLTSAIHVLYITPILFYLSRRRS